MLDDYTIPFAYVTMNQVFINHITYGGNDGQSSFAQVTLSYGFLKKFLAGGNTGNWGNWFMRILENSTTTDMIGVNDDMDTRSYGFLIKIFLGYMMNWYGRVFIGIGDIDYALGDYHDYENPSDANASGGLNIFIKKIFKYSTRCTLAIDW